MNVIFPAVVWLSLIAQDDSKVWADLIRDMLSTNAARTAEGHVDYDIAIKPRKSLGDHPARLQAEIDWDGPKFFTKYRFHSEYQALFDEIQTGPIDRAEWTIYMRNEGEFLAYNPDAKTFYIHVAETAFTQLLHLSPPELWGRCCPPFLMPGRPWTEMLGLIMTEGKEKSKVTTTVEGNEHIRHLRVDPDGHRVSILFSLKQGGNVEEIASAGKDGLFRKYSAKYAWTSIGNAWVLKSIEVDTYDPVVPDERMQISIKASNWSLVNRNKALFRIENVMALHPEAKQSYDHRANKQVRLDRPPVDNDARMKGLAEKLWSRGFAKRS